MEVSKQIEVLKDYARFAPEGETTMEEIASWVTQAIRFCREQKIPRLLVDLSRVTGFRRPPLQERYWAVREWAQEAGGVVVGRDLGRGLDSFVGSDGRGLDVSTRGLRKFSGNRVQSFACSMSLPPVSSGPVVSQPGFIAALWAAPDNGQTRTRLYRLVQACLAVWRGTGREPRGRWTLPS